MRDISTIDEYDRLSLKWTIVYSIISLGVYVPFWMLIQTHAADEVLPRKKISRELIGACFTLAFLGAILGILRFLRILPPMFDMINTIINYSYIVFYLVWLFKLRNRINEGMGSRSTRYEWFSGVLTFVCGIFYLQYKIAKVQDIVEQQNPMLGWHPRSAGGGAKPSAGLEEKSENE